LSPKKDHDIYFNILPSPIYITSKMATTSITRDRSPIAVLLDPNTDIPLGERDIRVEDYLNDKIQTITDLESLESLVANVDAQKKQLEDQVSGVWHIYQLKSQAKITSSSQMHCKNSPRPETAQRIVRLLYSSKLKNSRSNKLVYRNG
jgi:hypothetical protein